MKTEHDTNPAYDRPRLIKELAAAFAKSSGYDVNQAGVVQWEVTADALVKAIEGIARQVARQEVLDAKTLGN